MPVVTQSTSTGLINEIVADLEAISSIEQVWPRGLVHSGGPHYRLRGMLSPISIGQDECRAFGKVIETFRPSNAFIVGNAFGMSSVFIAKMMEGCCGRAVVTLDSMSEGDGERCFRIAGELRDRQQAEILTNKVGWSPQDVDAAADDDAYDLIFIDGRHTHPQVTRDFEACQHLATDETILCWHDYWIRGIPQSVAVAENNGFRCLKVNTSCEMAFGTRSLERFEQLGQLFKNSEIPRPRFRFGTYAKLSYTFMSFLINTYLLRRR